jgi:hypothetical protein
VGRVALHITPLRQLHSYQSSRKLWHGRPGRAHGRDGGATIACANNSAKVYKSAKPSRAAPLRSVSSALVRLLSNSFRFSRYSSQLIYPS